MRIKEKIERMLTAITDRIEIARYLWSDKNTSTRFKVLNFISADWLGNGVCDALYKSHMTRLNLEAVSGCPEDVTPEQYRQAVSRALKYLDKLDESLNGFYQI